MITKPNQTAKVHRVERSCPLGETDRRMAAGTRDCDDVTRLPATSAATVLAVQTLIYTYQNEWLAQNTKLTLEKKELIFTSYMHTCRQIGFICFQQFVYTFFF